MLGFIVVGMKKRILAAALMAFSSVAGANTSIEDKLAMLQEEIEHLKLQLARQDKNLGGVQGLVDGWPTRAGRAGGGQWSVRLRPAVCVMWRLPGPGRC